MLFLGHIFFPCMSFWPKESEQPARAKGEKGKWLERVSTLQTPKPDIAGPGRCLQIGSCISKALSSHQTSCRRIKHQVNFTGRIMWLKVTPWFSVDNEGVDFWSRLMREDRGTHSVRQLPQNEWLFEQNYSLALMVDRETTCVIWTKI
jgi:hypothetical protein